MSQAALFTDPLWTDSFAVGAPVTDLLVPRSGVVVSIDPARANAFTEDAMTLTVKYAGHLIRHGSSHGLVSS